jgi:hypothetical protein
MSAIPQAIAPNPHTNLLNVYIQIANKMGVKNIYIYMSTLTRKYRSLYVWQTCDFHGRLQEELQLFLLTKLSNGFLLKWIPNYSCHSEEIEYLNLCVEEIV